MSAPAFVDGIGVLLALLRAELDPSVHVYEDIPDYQDALLPMVTVSRAGGSSDRPVWVSDFFVHVNCWSNAGPDPFQSAFELSQVVARVLFWAKRNQTVAFDGSTPLGHIAVWRESSGFQRFTDPDLPHVGRYVAVYDLKIRNPRSI
ncbi:MAG TPA: hypothetical protein VIQ30_24245 [Pseudonocardia sp.]